MTFVPQRGDLFFQQRKTDASSRAIELVEKGYHDIPIGHVAVALNSQTLIEAMDPGGVQYVSIDFFLQNSQFNEAGAPTVIVGRFKPEFQKYIDEGVDLVQAWIGKPYDECFGDKLDAFYCSKLIQKAWENLFETHPMTFKDPKSGKVIDFWIEYFKDLNQPMPEGKMGSHPARLSRSEKIQIIYAYA